MQFFIWHIIYLFLSKPKFVSTRCSEFSLAYFLMMTESFSALYIALHLDIFCHIVNFQLYLAPGFHLLYLLSKQFLYILFNCPNNLNFSMTCSWCILQLYWWLWSHICRVPDSYFVVKSILCSWLKLCWLYTLLFSCGNPDFDAVWWFNSLPLLIFNRSMKSRILATYPDAFPDGSTGEVLDRRPDLETPH